MLFVLDELFKYLCLNFDIMDKNILIDFYFFDIFEYVVVFMLENCFFDNLFGFLYEDERFKIFEGKIFVGLNDFNCYVDVFFYVKGYIKNDRLKLIFV